MNLQAANYYQCPKCNYRITVPDYSRLISGQKTCFGKSQCDQDPRDYEFRRPDKFNIGHGVIEIEMNHEVLEL